MTNADWWARVVKARTEHEDLLPQRVWALRKGEHAAAIDLKAVPGVGAEIVLTVDGELRKTRLFRRERPARSWRARLARSSRSLSQARCVGLRSTTGLCTRRRAARSFGSRQQKNNQSRRR
jgi:hypothetical protein